MPVSSLRRMIWVALSTVTGVLAQGGSVTVRAPLVTSNVATSTPQLQPLQHVSVNVTAIGPSGGGYWSPIPPPWTNANGTVQAPPGVTTLVGAWIFGPSNEVVRVARKLGPGSYYSVPVHIQSWGVVDVTSPSNALGPTLLSIAECNAFQKTFDARQHLSQLLGVAVASPITVAFTPEALTEDNLAAFERDLYLLPPNAPIVTEERILIHMDNLDPDTALVARSMSSIAHEVGHWAIANSYPLLPSGDLDLPHHMREGFADFLASVVTSSSTIGAGIPQVSRDIDQPDVFYPSPAADPHDGGLVIAGALYDARALFGQNGLQALFDSYLPAMFAMHPRSEPEVLADLLLIDNSGNANLTNGTPHSSLLLHAFQDLHGIPAPPLLAGAHAINIAGGWPSPSGSQPHLGATVVTAVGSTLTTIRVVGTAGLGGWLFASHPLTTAQAIGLGLFVPLDLSTLVMGPTLSFGSSQEVTFALQLPPGMAAFAVGAGLVDPLAPLGVQVSNGLVIVP